MFHIVLDVHAMTEESAKETFKHACEDILKTNWEDANKGPVIWGHMSRQWRINVSELKWEGREPPEKLPEDPDGLWLLINHRTALVKELQELEARFQSRLDSQPA